MAIRALAASGLVFTLLAILLGTSIKRQPSSIRDAGHSRATSLRRSTHRTPRIRGIRFSTFSSHETLETRLVADGSELFMAGDRRLTLSPRTVTRIESGDRAADPLYPSWL
jgi:hypothetical protein